MHSYLFNVKDPIVNVGDARGSRTGDDAPEVERLTVGVSNRHIDNLAHVVLEEEAAVQIVVHLFAWNKIEMLITRTHGQQ